MEALNPGSIEPGEYDRLSAEGVDATRRGDFDAALLSYTRARRVAEQAGDEEGTVKADLNRAMVHLQMGEARKGEDGLREILLRTTDPRLSFSAAYNLASSLRQQGRYDRAGRYARRAMEKARELDSAELLAPAHNLIGNILLGQSYLDEALREYEGALAIWRAQPGDTRYLRAILEENMGYCLLLQKRFDEGIHCIRHALELAGEVGDRRCRAECLQDLCYGHLLRGDLEEAIAVGEQALSEAQEAGYADIGENSHYLLGELGSRIGDESRRDLHFEALQRIHPELPFLKDFLCAVDVTGIITLKR